MNFEEKLKKYWTPEKIKKITLGKKHVIDPLEGGLLLRTIGILNADASISADSMRKYKQINHMISILEPYMKELIKRHSKVYILDCGCGSSFLTFLLAWCFKYRWKHPALIFGVDSNQKVIQKCIGQSNELAFGQFLRFKCCDLSNFSWNEELRNVFDEDVFDENVRPHATIALHACNTATDLALGIGIALKSDFLAVCPCCQAELAAKWEKNPESSSHGLNILLQTPHLRRETGALMTDAMRILLTRGSGYEVTATEFVPSEHTPKNRIILCERRGNYHLDSLKEYLKLKNLCMDKGIFLEDYLSQEAKQYFAELKI